MPDVGQVLQRSNAFIPHILPVSRHCHGVESAQQKGVKVLFTKTLEKYRKLIFLLLYMDSQSRPFPDVSTFALSVQERRFCNIWH